MSVFCADVEGKGSFVAVDGGKVGTGGFAILIDKIGGIPVAGFVANFGAFDFDNVGAKVGQNLSGGRGGQDAR